MRGIRRLPLRGLYNCRDLGGFPVPGGQTKFGVFLRSEAPCLLPAEDLADLLIYGASTTIDLRGEMEREIRPSDLEHDWRFAYHALPLRHAEAAIPDGQPRKFKPWGDEYIEMIEVNHQWVRQALELAAATRGGLLYHCTTGKDRTGILSALLLSVAGVDRTDIAGDYCISELHLLPVYEQMRGGSLVVSTKQPLVMDEGFFRTKAEYMLQLLDYLDQTYGGVLPFLTECGVSEDTLNAIRRKFIQR